MIEIRNLTKIYRSGFFLRKKVGVQNLSLQVEKGEVFGFLGQNGAGKTTTIKVLVGLSHPTSGEVLILRQKVEHKAVRRSIGYVPESPYFYEYLTAQETMQFYSQLYGLPRSVWKQRIPELLELVGLTQEAGKQIRRYSKGMRQRLGLAQALLADPPVVIMDEPTSGLDPLGRRLVKELILQLKEKGKTVFFSSHILPDVEAICDRVGLIHKGKLVREGTVEDLVGAEPAKIEIICQGVPQEALLPLVDRLFCEGGLIYAWVSHTEQKQKAVEKIHQLGGKIEFIIPHRHSLEEYFRTLIQEYS